MNQIFVLIMIFGGSTGQSGLATLTQEFSSQATCEAARKTILAEAMKKDDYMRMRFQGCFAK